MKIEIYQKCGLCNKKVFFSSKCKCNVYYCEKHSLNHRCPFSYFPENRQRLTQEIKKIEPEKIIKL